MSLEVGQIFEGKVTGITKFGAFVELEDKTVGMVHISEVSNTYVDDIAEHLSLNQEVKVKVMKIGDDGKIAFSIKKAIPREPKERARRDDFRAGGNNRGSNNFKKQSSPRQNFQKQNNHNNFQPKNESQNFEDMLSKFMTSSADKMSGLKDSDQQRRRGGKRKNGKDDHYNY